MNINKCIILAAGLGTRFLPITKSIPKEMLPVVDKPVLQYLVEEAIASGAEEIAIVTNIHDKPVVERYFNEDLKLEEILKTKGKDKELEIVKSIPKLAKFKFYVQEKQDGDASAILAAKEFIQGEAAFGVLFGDNLIDNDEPALKQLLNIYELKNGCVIGLQEVEEKDIPKYGIVKLSEDNQISDLIEKPSIEEAPSNLAVVGKYVLTNEVLEYLETATASHAGEIRLADALMHMGKRQPIYGQKLEGKYFDTGDKQGMLNANIHFANL